MQKGEVEYSLRMVPLGGYVAFPDDDPDSPYPKGWLHQAFKSHRSRTAV